MAKCAVCGSEFEAKRATARYCSAKCRKLAFQQNGKISVPEAKPLSVPVIVPDIPIDIIPKSEVAQKLPLNFGQPDCQCVHCRQNRDSDVTNGRLIINHGAYKSFEELAKGEVNRVVFPSDPDYLPSGAS